MKFLIITAFIWMLLSFHFADCQEVTVVAERGDGIYSLLRKSGITPDSETISEFKKLNKGRIGKGDRIYIGREYKVPILATSEDLSDSIQSDVLEVALDSTNTIAGDSIQSSDKVDSLVQADKQVSNEPEKQYLTIPIFGKEHEEVEMVSEQLKGTYYYLISGHGGPDPGAIGKYQKKQLGEDEYAYDVTLRLARRLLSHGATVYIIIRDPDDGIRGESILALDKDEVAYPNLVIPRSQKARLKQRTEAVNKLFLKHKGKYQRLIIIHVDSRSEGENIDVFYYHDKLSKSGRTLALQLQETFEQKYAEFQPNRNYYGSVTARELYVLKNTYPAAVFIELGNIRNKADQKRFLIKENREALANWICSGLIAEFKSKDDTKN